MSIIRKSHPKMLEFQDRGLGDMVIEIAAEHYCTVEELLGGSRLMHVAKARRAMCKRLRGIGMSYPAIGRLLGQHHTTILESCKRTKWAKSRHGRVAE